MQSAHFTPGILLKAIITEYGNSYLERSLFMPNGHREIERESLGPCHDPVWAMRKINGSLSFVCHGMDVFQDCDESIVACEIRRHANTGSPQDLKTLDGTII